MEQSKNTFSGELESPYRLGARRGVAFGFWLCAMMFAFLYSVQLPILSFVAILMFAAVPFIIYKLLRKTYLHENCMTTLSGLWMQGIVIFACGAAICASVSVVYMKWLNPQYIYTMMTRAIDFYGAMEEPRAREVADLLQKLIDMKAVPTAAAVAMEMLWLLIFSGSLLSLLMALLAKSKMR